MSFRSNCGVLSLIKIQDNEEAKSLIKNESLHSIADAANNTLLHYAAEYGNLEIVQFLIDSGSAVDAQNDLGQTPLIRNLKSDLPCKDVIELLLRAGAVTDMDDSADDVFDLVNSNVWLNENDTTRFEILKVLLEYFGTYNFLSAAEKETIKALLQTVLDLPADDYNHHVAHILAMNSNPGVIELLRGINFDVNVRDKDGWTPLMYAANNNIANTVEFFLKEGADVEAATKAGQTALYIAIIEIIDNFFEGDEDNKRRIVQVLLEHGANVQVVIADDEFKTIFDLLSKDKDFDSAKSPLAHLALQEALGTVITDLIRSKIDSNRRFKSYFEYSQRQLSIKINPSVTLLDVLTASERRLERYFRNKDLAGKLIDLQTDIYYFHTIVRKRVSKASQMVELRKTAAQLVCKLMKSDIRSYPFVFDEIVSHFEKKDIEYLILIRNELF